MNYLLDVNVLVAWGWRDHIEHERTVIWIATVKRQAGTLLLTSAIPQLGFVRVSVQRAGSQVSVKEAAATLANMLNSLDERHAFLADDRPAKSFPDWCETASRTTDAHLVLLAQAHDAKLATLDTAIPGAFVLPSLALLRRGVIQPQSGD